MDGNVNGDVDVDADVEVDGDNRSDDSSKCTTELITCGGVDAADLDDDEVDLDRAYSLHASITIDNCAGPGMLPQKTNYMT